MRSKETKRRLVVALLDYLILKKIGEGRELSGYDLLRLFRYELGVYLSPSQVYPALTRFLNKSWVSARVTFSSRRKKVYRLTSEGERELEMLNEILNRLVNG